MGRGLGTMQRGILEALLPSKRLDAMGALNYRGGSNGYEIYGDTSSGLHRCDQVGLPNHAFDVRAVKALLKRVYGEASPRYIDTFDTTLVFDATFSRAIRSLIRRGVLRRASYDGYREVRFVTCPGGAPEEITTPEVASAVTSLDARKVS